MAWGTASFVFCGGDSEDWVPICDRLKDSEVRSAVHGDMRAGTRRLLNVAFDYTRALSDRHLYELDRLHAAVAQRDNAAGGPDVPDPVALVAEHRYEVPLVIDPRLDQREAPQLARISSRHLHNDARSRKQPAAQHRDPEPGIATSDSICAATLVHRPRLLRRIEER